MKSNFSGGLVLTGIACNTELAACVIDNIKQIAIFNVSLGQNIACELYQFISQDHANAILTEYAT